MSKLLSKWWFKWLVIGVIIRLVLMPITLHVDIWGHSFTAYFFAYEGKLNPYEALAGLPPDNPIVRNFGVSDIFIYPPLTYFTLGIFRLLIRPLVDPGFLPFVMANPGLIHQRTDLFWNLFLFKLPYLFLDIALAYFLANCFSDTKKRKMAFILWMFNPAALYATFMIGQIDILPTFFTVLATYFALRKKYSFASISLGIGASYKLYPLFLLAPLAFLFAKSFKEKVKLIVVGVMPLLLTILPYVSSKAFRYMVFSPKSQKILFMGWNVSGAEVIYPFLLILVVIYAISYYSRRKPELINYFLVILLLILSVTHYHPQWFIWVTPFIIFQIVRDNLKYFELALIFFASWIVITMFFEPSLSIGLFNPIYPAVNNFRGFTGIVSKYFDPFEIKSIIRSVFAGSSLFLALNLFKQDSSEDKS